MRLTGFQHPATSILWALLLAWSVEGCVSAPDSRKDPAPRNDAPTEPDVSRPPGGGEPSDGSHAPSELREALSAHVDYLARRLGARPAGSPANQKAMEWIEARLRESGLEAVRHAFDARAGTFYNVEGKVPGTNPADGMLVVGAHYDTVGSTPGADDNASGVALMLELARMAKVRPYRRDVVFVAFANEEPPFFRTADMGSRRYAQKQKEEGASIALMLSLEMVGFYDAGVTQSYPDPALEKIYPRTGDFVAVIANEASAGPARRLADLMKNGGPQGLGVESLVAPASLTGVDFSDHLSYWELGYPAAMITDTAFYRNEEYHRAGDTPDRLDYGKMAILALKIDTALRAL